MCEYEENQYLKYIEDNNQNLIDLINKIYIRENEEFIFKIDFNHQQFSYILKENNYRMENKIDSCAFAMNDTITLTYNLDDEEKKIIIQILDN